MSFLSRIGFRRARPPRPGASGSMDRSASSEDKRRLSDFVKSRSGVEFYVEPQTTVTTTTVVAIAADGEWIRRRVPSFEEAAKLAGSHGIPLYEANRVGYPQRMRDWTAAHPERRIS